ncbi:hypothetical protein OE09_2125 [Flavobacteriaceae bacterium MAR_2010_72]|nr:hypothetical protein OE09_2125 [Flavobacteriaceae bacterium MAR_2010_72]
MFKSLKTDYIIIAIGILTILPFLILSIFNHPSADDYIYHYISDEFGFVEAQVYWYNNWTSRYLASAVLSIKMLVSGDFVIYKLIPIGLLVSFFCSLVYLLSSLFKTNGLRYACFLAFYVLILYLFQMPNVSEGFYWLPGSISYIFPSILSLILFTHLIKLVYKRNRLSLGMSILMCFLIIGSSETSMIILDCLITIVLGYRYFIERKVNTQILMVFITCVLLSVFVLLSPGNAIRALGYTRDNHQFFEAFFNSLLALKTYVGVWLPFLLLFTMFVLKGISSDDILKLSVFHVHPLISFIVVVFITAFGFFPSYWAQGSIGPPTRTINVMYFYFIIGFVYFVFTLIYYYKKKNVSIVLYPNWVRYTLLIMVLLELGHYNNIRFAYTDLLGGKAYNYDKSLKMRYEAIKNSNHDTIWVPRLKYIPKTIYHDDISTDRLDWKNTSYDDYYGKTILLLDTY